MPICRCAKCIHHFIELIEFICTGEQWTEIVEFSHDTSDGEDIYRGIVGLAVEKDLWCTIPTSRYVFSEWRTTTDLFEEKKMDIF